MSRVYLYGPVRREWPEAHLPRAVGDGTCVPFGPEDTWDSARARVPGGAAPDFVAVYLAYATVPDWVWEAPVPTVGLAMDANLQLHRYRRCLRRLDLTLTDLPSAEVLTRAGVPNVHVAHLYGPDQDCMAFAPPAGDRDIDVLFIGSAQPAVQRERLAWLGRLARLADRWRVVIASGVFGDDYRALHGRARVVVNRSVRGEANQRAFEAALAGALLLQERSNREVPALFEDGRECVLYGGDDLEERLEHYLRHEDERRAIADAGRRKALGFSHETLWGQALAVVESEWEALGERAARRASRPETADALERLWEALGSQGPASPSLTAGIERAVAASPSSASLHNALGVAVTLSQLGSGPGRAAISEQAAGHFLEALRRDPRHVVAGLNLAEAQTALGQDSHAAESCRRMLAALAAEDEGKVPSWLDDAHSPPGFDTFRVEWERCAWTHAGDLVGEAAAKRELLRWRLHALLGQLTGELSHLHEAALARPDLPQTRGELGCALARGRRFAEAVPHLHRAAEGNPFDRTAARAMFQALHDAGDEAGQRRLARAQRLLAKAAPGLVPEERWFREEPPVGDELASLIILCCNEAVVSRLCLESVLRNTRAPYELILVDNGSTDATQALLEEVCQRPGPERVVVIRNEDNRGFPAGCNQGLAEARGEYLVFLNNDTVVTPGWLDGLIAWSLHDWPTVGLVGAVSNYAPPPQLVEADYQDLSGLNAFADRRRQQFASNALEAQRLTGFCLLMRRALLSRLGGFDERFGLGFFDDDDLCLRARRAGFRLLVALGTYIHHFGSRTFKALGVECQGQLEDNLALYRQKWGEEEASRYRPMGEGSAPTPTTVVAAPRQGRAQVSCCIITKNEEQNIADCLRCVLDLADEVVVTDTGSTDRTKEIAAEMGAKVYDFAWVDSFSAARNASIANATGDWIFWVDADDRIDEENRVRLKALFAGLGPENRAFVMNCFCVPDAPSSTGTTVTHVRLFRNHSGVRWEHRVHEQILPALRRSGAEVLYTDLVIRHTGYVDPALRAKKLERDMRYLRLEEAEQPDHPFTLFNLAMTTLDLGRLDAAQAYVRKSLALSHPSDSIVRKLYAMLAQCLWRQGEGNAALAEIAAGRGHYPDDEELLWLEGLYREDLGDLPGSEAALRRLVEGSEAAHLSSVVGGLRTVRGREALGRVCFRLGRLADAEAQWANVLAESPTCLPAWAGLADVCAAEQRWDEAERALRRVLELDSENAGARANLEVVLRNLGR